MAWEIEWMIPRPPELNACAAMYCAYIMPSRPGGPGRSTRPPARFSAVSLIAYNALPSDGGKFSRETYGSDAWASTSNPHWAV
jgi:hypothetical protein